MMGSDKIAETVARLLRQSEQAYALADTAQNSLSWRLEARGALLRISKAGCDAADLLEALARDPAALAAAAREWRDARAAMTSMVSVTGPEAQAAWDRLARAEAALALAVGKLDAQGQG